MARRFFALEGILKDMKEYPASRLNTESRIDDIILLAGTGHSHNYWTLILSRPCYE
ncbi:hypothetical protein J23TS9_51100 [Paenibacillus sp. J23TS9]|nr:hypothetical protein J23TS9_51100 [Paenibacillus sp. J23TS9]